MTKPKSAEDKLVDKYVRVVGYAPIGLRDVLHVIAHPDVIEFTKQYLAEQED